MKKDKETPNGAGKEHSIDEWFNGLNQPDGFCDDVFKNLPDFFTSLIDLFSDSKQQDTALFCSLILLSGVLPNYKVLYDGEVLDANLFGYLYGAASSGKGVMRKCKQLLLPIHQEKKKRTAAALLKYDQQMAARKRKRKKGNCIIKEGVVSHPDTQAVDDSPVPPPDEMLFVAANNTKSNIYPTMASNSGVIMCEPEAMTLTTALKQEHGAFTDLLLQAFHHETFSYSRKSERTIEIEHPLLTVLLSSTPRHVSHFFGDPENGLFSRFAFYRLNSASDFRNPYRGKNANINTKIDIKAKVVKKVYDHLSGLSMPLYFTLTSQQADSMFNYFNSVHKEYKKQFGEDMDGVVKRHGVIFTRLAMILSMFRTYETDQLKMVDEVVCSDDDFKCALSITDTLLGEALKVYEMLMGSKRPQTGQAALTSLELKIEQQNQFIELYNAGHSMSEIAKIVLGNAALKPTVWRQLKKLGIIKNK
ncbi:MAG: DUF3987 domain-containing protein [Bacteroidetes bacterium]|nr:DUF3987 domain-containing protein [Bacteroidota bacterium]